MRNVLAVMSAVLLFLASSHGLMAQTLYSVSGTVVDSTQAIVPGTTVKIVDAGGKELATASSDASGHFVLRGLRGGQYSVISEASASFANATLPVTVIKDVINLSLVLRLAAVTATVNVNGDQPSTDPNSNKDSVVISGSSLESLPVFDQNYIAALTPFLDPGSAGTGGVSLTVDGVEATSLGVSPSAIQEIHLNNDPYSAESNRPGRARIDVITKQATSAFHGTVNVIFRDSALNAANYYSPVKPPEQRRIYEGSILGPLGHSGRNGFLLSSSRKEEDLATSVHAVGLQGPISSNVLTPSADTTVAFRLSRNLSDAHQAYLQYDFEKSSAVNQGVGALVLPEAGVNTYSQQHNVTINDRYILSPKLINQFGARFGSEQMTFQSVTNAPSVIVKDSFSGGGSQANLYRTENSLRLNDVMSWSHGAHYVRFGVNIPNLGRRAVDDQTNRLGTFGFTDLAALRANKSYVYTVQQGAGRGVYWFNEIGGFVQDQIKLSPTFQVSLGLRYDWQTYLNDYNNLAPRVSLAWAPFEDQKTVFRVGSGVFYDRTGGDTLATVVLHNGVRLRQYQIENPGYPAPLPSGQALSTLPTNLARFDPAVRTPYSIQYSAGIERKLSAKSTFTIGYRGVIGVGLFRSRDANAPLSPAYTTRPDLSIGQLQTVESKGRQSVNALDVGFQGSTGRWFAGQAQYTLGRTENNTDGIFFFPQNQYDPSAEWGRSSLDRLQRLNVLGTINPGHWLSLGVGLTAYSGTPYTETLGADSFATGLGNARPAGVGRNTLDTPGQVSLDLRWSHDWALTKSKGDHARVFTFGFDGFNILNEPNFTNYAGSVNSPLFRQPTAALPGRQLQVGARFRF